MGLSSPPITKPTTLEVVAKRFREYPRPAKVESVATEQEPHATKAGAFFVGGSSRRRLPHPHPRHNERSVSPSSRLAPLGRTDAVEDRTDPGNMMARLRVDGQDGTGQDVSVSRGRKSYKCTMAEVSALATFGGPGTSVVAGSSGASSSSAPGSVDAVGPAINIAAPPSSAPG